MLNFIGRTLLRWLEQWSKEETDRPPAPPVLRAPAEPLTSPDEKSKEGSFVFPRVQRPAMGCLFEIYLAGTDRVSLLGAANEALDEIERLDRQLSHYRDDSDIARLNAYAAQQWVRLEPRLYQLLKHCAALSVETEGAFDITAGRLVKAWGFHHGTGRIPPADEIAEILQGIGANRILFDEEDHLVYFTSPQVEINLGAIGKGYALDEAADVLRFYGVQSAVLHGGQSTIYALGAPPGAEGWEFTIKDPRDKTTVLQSLLLRDEALSTSGSYEQFFEANGVRYSHLLDPRKGYPTQGMLSVSVAAPSAAISDALSTAFFIQGRAWTEAYCHAHPELCVVMMEEVGGGEVMVSRFGFENKPERT